nr:hypothetical protein [Tanacetum cinerariifolium]
VLRMQSLSSPSESHLYLEVEASLYVNICADEGVEGVVAVAGDALKVFTIERFGEIS